MQRFSMSYPFVFKCPGVCRHIAALRDVIYDLLKNVLLLYRHIYMYIIVYTCIYMVKSHEPLAYRVLMFRLHKVDMLGVLKNDMLITRSK